MIARLRSFPRVSARPRRLSLGLLKNAKWRFAVDVPVQSHDLESRLHAVERIPLKGRGRPTEFTPYRFEFTNKIAKEHKLLLAFDALVLSDALGCEVGIGKIVHGEDDDVLKVKTCLLVDEVRKCIKEIVALVSGEPPDLVLNRHCSQCEFQTRCRRKAIEKDDLSLLSGMSETERKKLHDRGIFTVTQLSYTFRPRRRAKQSRGKQEKHHHSLRALAIREKKVHAVCILDPKIDGTPVHLDVEGLPDRDFYYLIGVRVGTAEGAVQHSFWADGAEEEEADMEPVPRSPFRDHESDPDPLRPL